MADQDLRDKNGHLVGRIKTLSGGKLELRGPGGQLLGTYDPKANQTRDAGGKLIGSGNILTTLLR
jgi:hypothetical protein